MSKTEPEPGRGRLRGDDDPVVAESMAWHRANPNAGLSSKVEWQRLVDEGVDMDEEYFKIYGEYPLTRSRKSR